MNSTTKPVNRSFLLTLYGLNKFYDFHCDSESLLENSQIQKKT